MNAGGPAFPQPATSEGYAANSPFAIAGGGMTLRDYFAGQVVASLTDPKLVADILKKHGFPGVAAYCYGLADAMIVQRAETK